MAVNIDDALLKINDLDLRKKLFDADKKGANANKLLQMARHGRSAAVFRRILIALTSLFTIPLLYYFSARSFNKKIPEANKDIKEVMKLKPKPLNYFKVPKFEIDEGIKDLEELAASEGEKASVIFCDEEIPEENKLFSYGSSLEEAICYNKDDNFCIRFGRYNNRVIKFPETKDLEKITPVHFEFSKMSIQFVWLELNSGVDNKNPWIFCRNYKVWSTDENSPLNTAEISKGKLDIETPSRRTTNKHLFNVNKQEITTIAYSSSKQQLYVATVDNVLHVVPVEKDENNLLKKTGDHYSKNLGGDSPIVKVDCDPLKTYISVRRADGSYKLYDNDENLTEFSWHFGTDSPSEKTEKEQKEIHYAISEDSKHIAHIKRDKTILSIPQDQEDTFTTFTSQDEYEVCANTKNGFLYKIELDVDLDAVAETFKPNESPTNNTNNIMDQNQLNVITETEKGEWIDEEKTTSDSPLEKDPNSSEDLSALYANLFEAKTKNSEMKINVQHRVNAFVLKDGNIFACDPVENGLALNLFSKNDGKNSPKPMIYLFNRENNDLRNAKPCINDKKNSAIFFHTKGHLFACDFKGNLIRDINIDWPTEDVLLFPLNFTQTKNDFYAEVVVYSNDQFTRLKIENNTYNAETVKQAPYKVHCPTYMPASEKIYFQGQSQKGSNEIYALNAKTLESIKVFELEKNDRVQAIAESNDKNYLAVVFENSDAALFKANNKSDFELVYRYNVASFRDTRIFDMRFVNDDKDLQIATDHENSRELSNFIIEKTNLSRKVM